MGLLQKVLLLEEHTIKMSGISETSRSSTWNDTFGIATGMARCFVCENNWISQRNFECGHIVCRACGGPATPNNLKPICSPCNKSMGKRDMHEFIMNEGHPKSRNLAFMREFSRLTESIKHDIAKTSEERKDMQQSTVIELRDMCREKNLKTGGIKVELINRLLQHTRNEEKLLSETQQNEKEIVDMDMSDD